MEKIGFLGYQCMGCQKRYPGDAFLYTCLECGENLDCIWDYGQIQKVWTKKELAQNPDPSLWRYLPLLPVHNSPENSSIQVGNTPLVSLPKLAQKFQLQKLWIKDDTRNPSGSLKDRASEVGLRHGIERGYSCFIAASTGNAAASLACLSAFYGQKSLILVPASAPKAKLVQILQYGAYLLPIEGSYDQAFDLSLQIAQRCKFYSRSTGINPVLSEGKKTVVFEVEEALKWEVPDKVFVPVGDGCIIGGVFKGFYDLYQLGWISKIPQIMAVQAKGSAAIVKALEKGGQISPVQASTLADSISVDYPRDGKKALRAIESSKGFGVILTDEEILEAQKTLSQNTGIFAEPAAAAAYGGFQKAFQEGKITKGEKVLLLITGSGLKDIPKAEKDLNFPSSLPPQEEKILERLEQLGIR